ncbi:D-alanyl-D-alanine carboxypeptidase [Peribacillus cavernae]|uniref:serine-type D-Ala-D-Ala carboxypeptidase n=1 Tax=Peribacillus cavernae TaxID=1674310 RepID=A0A433HDX0_9BACI|nr:D-alanyl-D-alanine carboxypeptidase family protein [Peribacillus cavernae]MDQ0219058.1 D-alanyl-D-alanine carboxypeptidase (penicillin-binding protein 5/6) [Peribacillus cavernae]RUQ26511.1 D-alanyl-D-alanine carboxypeptidase [Peribacillus cavernae]
MKRFLFLCFALLLAASVVVPNAYAEGEKGVNLADNSKSAILIERDTGAVLYEKNSNEKLPPASMTKIMTMVLIMDSLDKGELTLKEKIRTSEYAASMGGSQIFLEAGEEMTVEHMLQGIAIGSGNDASVAMAERLAGSEEEFVKKMNEKAAELGLKHTKFQNATGLPVEDHYSTSHDMAIMAKELLKYDMITKFTGTYEAYLREDTDKKFWLVNTNRLVKFYPGVDGLKTGFTNEAKYCLTATGKKGNMRVIAVVMGAPSPKERNAEVTKMLDYAFSQFTTHPIYKRGVALKSVPVSKGSKKTIIGVTSEPISVLTKKSGSSKDFTQKISMHQNLKAPIKQGDKIGMLKVIKDGKTVVDSPIVAKDDMEKASWWEMYKRAFGKITQSK